MVNLDYCKLFEYKKRGNLSCKTDDSNFNQPRQRIEIAKRNTYLGKFDHDLTVLPNPGIMVHFREIIPFYGPTIQASELL